jgi:lipopolysaccharide exporter
MKIIKKSETSESLIALCLRSGGVLTAGNFVENLSRFIRNVVLARLLAPEAFGLMATVISAGAAIEAFAEVGLRQSVIQNKHGADEGFLNITWWVSGIRGSLLYLIAFSMAPFIGEFFHKPASVTFLRFGFLGILLNGLVSPRIHVLEKEMRFKKWVVLTQGSALGGIVLTIVLAFIYRSPWALVIGYVTEPFLKAFFSYITLPFRPKLKFHSVYTHDILEYSKRMFGLPILMMVSMQTDIFVIGSLLPLPVLGIYSLTKGLAEMPNAFISKIIHPVVLPAFSLIKDDKEKLCNTLLKATETLGCFLIPFFTILAIFSREIVSVVYGSAYSQGAISFGILCIMNMILTFSALIMLFYMGIGRPDIHRNAALIRTVMLLFLIYPATKYFGLPGAATSVLFGMITSWSVQVIYLKRLMSIESLRYYKAFATGIKDSAFVIISAMLFKVLFNSGDRFGLGVAIFLCMVAWGLTLRRVSNLKKQISLMGTR